VPVLSLHVPSDSAVLFAADVSQWRKASRRRTSVRSTPASVGRNLACCELRSAAPRESSNFLQL